MLLSGCTSESLDSRTPENNTDAKVFTVHLDNGRQMKCIYLERGNGDYTTGGPSCDWPKSNQTT